MTESTPIPLIVKVDEDKAREFAALIEEGDDDKIGEFLKARVAEQVISTTVAEMRMKLLVGVVRCAHWCLHNGQDVRGMALLAMMNEIMEGKLETTVAKHALLEKLMLELATVAALGLLDECEGEA